jgi:c-Jun-amino-terminal kinase-interacting protein 4
MASESIKSKPIFSPNRARIKLSDENNPAEHELSSSATSEESHALLSETVTTLASNVYNELERIIKNFGEDSVKDLMPVMISTLGRWLLIIQARSMMLNDFHSESLDSALNEREGSKVEIESLKEQNEHLFQQYEREKGFHKEYQQVTWFKCICSHWLMHDVIVKRYLQVEDHLEEMKRESEEKLQSLESIVKIFEIKARNASDHVARLEEKETDMKQEHKRLHERYCEVKNRSLSTDREYLLYSC